MTVNESREIAFLKRIAEKVGYLSGKSEQFALSNDDRDLANHLVQKGEVKFKFHSDGGFGEITPNGLARLKA